MREFFVRAIINKPVIVIERGGEILAELKRQGNNLNQLARIANSEKSVAGVVPRLVGLLDFYEEVVKRIKGYFHDR